MARCCPNAEPVAMSHPTPPFPQTVLDALARAGDRPVFEHGPRTVTGSETLAMIRAAASGLRAIGFGTGDAIALLPGVLPEGFAVMLAAFTLGLRVSAVRPGLTPAQFAHLVAEGNDAIVADPRTASPEVLAAAGATPLHTPDGLVAYPDDGVALVPSGNLDDVARILYTSGSTGVPKGVVATYRTMREDWSIQPDRWSPALADFAERMRRVLLFGTLASPVVLNHVMLALFTGGVAVIPDVMPQPLFPDVVERYRITGSIMTVPRLYQMLDRLGERPVDMSSLRALMVSGSPLNPKRYAAALAQLGPVIFQMYGQIEAGAFTLLTPAEIEAVGESALNSVGRPHPWVDIEIRDELGAVVGPGATGELFMRTPYQTAGYWRDPEQTADVYVDGWVRTRDLGYLDARGYLHLTGRTRDVIIVNGMVYYAGPIEQALANHPDVDQAYVVAAPDEQTGEAIHAYVVAAPGRTPDLPALRAHVRAELGEASAPATFTVIPQVIAAPSGKPDKRALLVRYPPEPAARA